MYILEQSNVDFWKDRDIDKPHYINGFKGTWNFSDHSLIPQPLFDFILESFHPEEKIKRIPLEDINKLMNEVWEGPGSMVKIVETLRMLRQNRYAGKPNSLTGLDPVKTIDDFSDEEKTTVRHDDE